MKDLIFILICFITTSGLAQKTISNKKKMCDLLTEMRANDQLYRSTLSEYSRDREKYSEKEICYAPIGRPTRKNKKVMLD